jgi:hypothetical protein
MSLLGHWLHFGFNEMMQMEVSILMDFVAEAEDLAKSG